MSGASVSSFSSAHESSNSGFRPNAIHPGDDDNIFEEPHTIQLGVFGVLYTVSKEKELTSVKFAFFRLFLDFLQLWLLVVNPSYGWAINGKSSVWQAVSFIQLNAFLTARGYTFFLGMLYVFVGLLGVNLALSVWVAHSFSNNRFEYVWPIQFLRWFGLIFYQVLDIATLTLLLVTLDCNYFSSDPDVKFYNQEFPDIMCWSMPHIVHVAVSVASILLFFVAALAMVLSEMELNPLTKNYMAIANTRDEGICFTIKTILTIASVTLSSAPKVLAAVYLFFFLMLFYIYLRWLPFIYSALNYVRCASYATVLYSSVLLAALAYGPRDQQEYRERLTLALWVGMAPAALLGAFCCRLRLRHFSTVLARFRDAEPGTKSKAIHRFGDVREVAIAARCCRQWVDEDTLEPEAVALSEQVIKAGITQLPNEPQMIILYSSFLIDVQGSYQSGYTQLQNAKKQSPGVLERFAIFSREQEHAQKAIGASSGDSAVDLVSYVEFQRNHRLVVKAHREALIAMRAFWGLLLHAEVDFNHLSRSLNRIEVTVKAAERAYRSVLIRHAGSARIVRLYGKFLESVKFDPWAASKWFTEADRLEEEAEHSKEALQLGGIETLLPQGVVGDRSGLHAMEGVAFICMNAQGIIQVASNEAHTLLGYGKNELKGKDVGIMMPQPFGERHVAYVRNYIQTGKSVILGRSHEMPVISKSRQVIPVRMYASKVSGLNEDSIFLGVLEPLPVSTTEGRVWVLGNGIIVAADALFCDWLGYDPPDITGKAVDTLLVEDEVMRDALKSYNRAQPPPSHRAQPQAQRNHRRSSKMNDVFSAAIGLSSPVPAASANGAANGDKPGDKQVAAPLSERGAMGWLKRASVAAESSANLGKCGSTGACASDAQAGESGTQPNQALSMVLPRAEWRHKYREPLEFDTIIQAGSIGNTKVHSIIIRRCTFGSPYASLPAAPYYHDMLLVADHKGRVLHITKLLAAALGRTPEAIRSGGLSLLIPEPTSVLHGPWLQELSNPQPLSNVSPTSAPPHSCRSGVAVSILTNTEEGPDMKQFRLSVRQRLAEPGAAKVHVVAMEPLSLEQAVSERRLRLTLDLSGTILSADEATPAKLFGADPRELVGSSISQLVDLFQLDEMDEILAGAGAGYAPGTPAGQAAAGGQPLGSAGDRTRTGEKSDLLESAAGVFKEAMSRRLARALLQLARTSAESPGCSWRVGVNLPPDEQARAELEQMALLTGQADVQLAAQLLGAQKVPAVMTVRLVRRKPPAAAVSGSESPYSRRPTTGGKGTRNPAKSFFWDPSSGSPPSFGFDGSPEPRGVVAAGIGSGLSSSGLDPRTCPQGAVLDSPVRQRPGGLPGREPADTALGMELRARFGGPPQADSRGYGRMDTGLMAYNERSPYEPGSTWVSGAKGPLAEAIEADAGAELGSIGLPGQVGERWAERDGQNSTRRGLKARPVAESTETGMVTPATVQAMAPSAEASASAPAAPVTPAACAPNTGPGQLQLNDEDEAMLRQLATAMQSNDAATSPSNPRTGTPTSGPTFGAAGAPGASALAAAVAAAVSRSGSGSVRRSPKTSMPGNNNLEHNASVVQPSQAPSTVSAQPASSSGPMPLASSLPAATAAPRNAPSAPPTAAPPSLPIAPAGGMPTSAAAYLSLPAATTGRPAPTFTPPQLPVASSAPTTIASAAPVGGVNAAVTFGSPIWPGTYGSTKAVSLKLEPEVAPEWSVAAAAAATTMTQPSNLVLEVELWRADLLSGVLEVDEKGRVLTADAACPLGRSGLVLGGPATSLPGRQVSELMPLPPGGVAALLEPIPVAGAEATVRGALKKRASRASRMGPPVTVTVRHNGDGCALKLVVQAVRRAGPLGSAYLCLRPASPTLAQPGFARWLYNRDASGLMPTVNPAGYETRAMTAVSAAPQHKSMDSLGVLVAEGPGSPGGPGGPASSPTTPAPGPPPLTALHMPGEYMVSPLRAAARRTGGGAVVPSRFASAPSGGGEAPDEASAADADPVVMSAAPLPRKETDPGVFPSGNAMDTANSTSRARRTGSLEDGEEDTMAGQQGKGALSPRIGPTLQPVGQDPGISPKETRIKDWVLSSGGADNKASAPVPPGPLGGEKSPRSRTHSGLRPLEVPYRAGPDSTCGTGYVDEGSSYRGDGRSSMDSSASDGSAQGEPLQRRESTESSRNEGVEEVESEAGAHVANYTVGKRFKKLQKLLMSPLALQPARQLRLRATAAIVAVAAAHTVVFVLLLVQLVQQQAAVNDLFSVSEAARKVHEIAINGRVLDALYTGNTYTQGLRIFGEPRAEKVAEMYDELAQLSVELKELHHGVYLGFRTFRRITVRYGLRSIWDNHGLNVSVYYDLNDPARPTSLLPGSDEPVIVPMGLWDAGNLYHAKTLDLINNGPRLVAEGLNFTSWATWRFIRDNGVPVIFPAYLDTLDAMVALTVAASNRIYKLQLIVLVLEGGLLCMLVCIYMWIVARKYSRKRYELYGVFIQIPVAVTRGLANMSLVLEAADDDDDDDADLHGNDVVDPAGITGIAGVDEDEGGAAGDNADKPVVAERRASVKGLGKGGSGALHSAGSIPILPASKRRASLLTFAPKLGSAAVDADDAEMGSVVGGRTTSGGGAKNGVVPKVKGVGGVLSSLMVWRKRARVSPSAGGQQGGGGRVKRSLMDSNRLAYAMVAPFVLWGFAIIAVNLVGYYSLEKLAAPIATLNIVNVVAIRFDRVLYYVLAVASSWTTMASDYFKSILGTELANLKLEYLAMLYGNEVVPNPRADHFRLADVGVLFGGYSRPGQLLYHTDNCLCRNQNDCHTADSPYYQVTHNGLDVLLRSIFGAVESLIGQPYEASGLNSTEFRLVWSTGETDAEGGLWAMSSTFLDEVQGSYKNVAIEQIAMFVLAWVIMLAVLLVQLRPIVRRAQNEMRRIAELLSQLPGDVDCEALVTGVILGERGGSVMPAGFGAKGGAISGKWGHANDPGTATGGAGTFRRRVSAPGTSYNKGAELALGKNVD